MSYDVFISYSHKDTRMRNELANHLAVLRYQDLIRDWYDGDIVPGTEWEPLTMQQLHTAQIILLLISARFIASKFCYSIELKAAMERHDAGTARVIPILLSDCEWGDTPFAKLKVLPYDGKPVTKWPLRDAAYTDIVQGIKRVIQDLKTKGHS